MADYMWSGKSVLFCAARKLHAHDLTDMDTVYLKDLVFDVDKLVACTVEGGRTIAHNSSRRGYGIAGFGIKSGCYEWKVRLIHSRILSDVYKPSWVLELCLVLAVVWLRDWFTRGLQFKTATSHLFFLLPWLETQCLPFTASACFVKRSSKYKISFAANLFG